MESFASRCSSSVDEGARKRKGHPVDFEEAHEVSQSSSLGYDELDESCDGINRSTNCCGDQVIQTVASLKDDEKKEVREKGFGSFLDLKLGKLSKLELVEHLIDISKLEEDRIAMHINSDMTLNITPEVIEKLVRVPRGDIPALKDFRGYKAEFDRVRDLLGLRKGTALTFDLVHEKFEAATDRNVKLRCFFLILISKYLLPSTAKNINIEAVMYTKDMTKIDKFDWCSVIYQDLRTVIKDWWKSKKTKSRTIPGCVSLILVYFVDNIRTGNLEEIEENEVEKTETFPRINLYTRQKVFDILKSAKVRVRDGKFVRKIQLKAREDTCYGESSITQMNSLESQWISAVVSEGVVSEGILAGERMGQCSSVQSLHGLCPQNKQKRLHGLLFEMRKYAPDELKQQVSEFLGPEAEALRMTPTTTVDTLYDRLVLSKVKSSNPDKVVVDINNHVITETIFVDSFKPEGQMTPFALHAQCSIWNDCYCDRIYLKEESAMDLQQAGADQNLSCQLPENKMKHVKLIFVPVFCLGQCFLIVANFEKHSFDYLDSTDSTTGYQCAHEMTKNLKKYLKKCGINCDNWGFVTTPVKAHNNIYDSGYCLMLHMIHYGTAEVFRIDEEMISAYRKRFAVELFYHRTNKVCHTSSANKFDSGRTTSGTLSSAHPTSTNQTLLELQAVSENCGDEDQLKTSTAARDGDKSNTAARDDNQSNTAARDADQEHRARRSALKTGYTTVAQYTKVPGSRSKELYDFIFSEGTELTDDRELATINGVSVTRDVVLKSFSVPVESCEVLHAFINCLKLNDRKNNRKERIFFLPLTSSIIENKEEAAKKIKEDMPKPFPKDYELIFFPILHEGKWVIFCVNNRHSRMEIMNINVSKNETVQLRSSCLPVFLYGMKQVKTGNVKKPSFDNWKYNFVEISKTSARATLVAMRFLENYDGSLSFKEDDLSWEDYMMSCLDFILYH